MYEFLAPGAGLARVKERIALSSRNVNHTRWLRLFKFCFEFGSWLLHEGVTVAATFDNPGLDSSWTIGDFA